MRPIKLPSRRDRNLKEMLARSVPFAHRKDRVVNQLGSCSRCGSQRCGLCEIGILVETNIFCSFTIRYKYLSENQVKFANAPSKQKCITSFTPIYHPVISEIHKIIRKNLRSALDSIVSQLSKCLKFMAFREGCFVIRN